MPCQNRRILYVDDDPDTCVVMKEWLASDDGEYDIVTATSIEEAKALIANRCFDLYILDYCLPSMTGAELCRNIRRVDASVPVVIYSALARPVDRESAKNAGANFYLVKPDDFDLLRPAVRQLLERRTYFSLPRAAGGFRARAKARSVI